MLIYGVERPQADREPEATFVHTQNDDDARRVSDDSAEGDESNEMEAIAPRKQMENKAMQSVDKVTIFDF